MNCQTQEVGSSAANADVTPQEEPSAPHAAADNSKDEEPKDIKKQDEQPHKERTPDKDESEKVPDVIDFLRELRNPELRKYIAETNEYLTSGSHAYLSGNYRKAVESYKVAKERIGQRLYDFDMDERQYHVIKYAYCTALINLNTYDDIVNGIHGLNEMETHRFSIPALYVQIARGYYKLNRFKNALEPLEKVQDILDNVPIFPTLTWPGTNETIQETTPVGLKNAIKELSQLCRMSHKPTAICRFDNCLKNSSHIAPSELIYSSDPDFIGYVRMICEEKCHIEFHIPCWKAYKESICGIGKINDKDLLGQRCLTTDCVNSGGEPSIIITIEIIGSDGQLKSVNKFENKTSNEQKPAEKKAKKKRTRLDDKEKVSKSKKLKEKKPHEPKKQFSTTVTEEETPIIANQDVEDEDAETQEEKPYVDPVKSMMKRKDAWKDLRKYNFGVAEKNEWNPKLSFYGRKEESQKVTKNQFLDMQNSDSIEVKDAKEFLFSYFHSILKDEGPLKVAEIQELWKESAEGFCDITVVLPNLKNMCDLLLESTRFCQLEDYVCLSEQIDQTYDMVKTQVSETVAYLMTGCMNQETENQETENQHSQPSTNSTHEDGESSSGEEEEEDESEYESSDVSVESDEADSEDEGKVEMKRAQPQPLSALTNVISKPLDEAKFSFQDMLNEMSRMKNILVKGSDETELSPMAEEVDNKDREESASNETFETARGSSVETIPEENKTDKPGDNSNCNEDTDDIEDVGEEAENQSESGSVIHNADQDETQGEPDQVTEGSECDKGSQSEVTTEERHIQTAPVETRSRLSQTKESDSLIELNKKIQDLTEQLNKIRKVNQNLGKDLITAKQNQKLSQDLISQLQEENRKTLESQKTLLDKLKTEFSKKEKDFKKREEELNSRIGELNDLYKEAVNTNKKLKKDMASLLVETTEAKKSLETALNNIKQIESNHKTSETNAKLRLQKALQAQLNIIKNHYGYLINQYKSRCVEKISEMQNWFSISPEVEDLPSYPLIQQSIVEWMDMGRSIQQIESEVQVNFNMLESRIFQEGEIEDLSLNILPAVPKEPPSLPLDKIHKEITEKHLKRISELTQLVANQQLQIEKAKEQSQMLMNSYSSQMVPRLAAPMTTAFGSLALQYPYPQPPPLSVIPTTTQSGTKVGKPVKGLPAEMQTIQDDFKRFLQPPSLISPGSLKEDCGAVSGQTPPLPSLFSPPPPLSAEPPTKSQFLNMLGLPVTMPMPPPPIGVAQNLLKTSVALTEQHKEIQPPEQDSAFARHEPKVGSSRESTPGPVPTPEKSKKKKKKSKTESKEIPEAKPVVSAENVETVNVEATEEDDSGWNVVLPKNALPKHSASAPPVVESKTKNKKKLLDKLQLKFPTLPMKEIDEAVKLVREQSNGTLSGLPFDEIEARVERVVAKKQLQKNSSMGLVKFSDAAWGTVKQQDAKPWTNLQLEECTICLEPMGNERTKVDCNHEFHTKCLRKWLKEKSVCPLCNKFTTMPDEFPAL